MRIGWFTSFLLIARIASPLASAQTVRPVPPPPKTELTVDQRNTLESEVSQLADRITAARQNLAAEPSLLARLPDVQIYWNAVRYPLKYHEQIDFAAGEQAIHDGLTRLDALQEGKTPWTLESGPRGYVSAIDGSVQPYVLLIPTGYRAEERKKYPLEFVEHGRDETLTELRMIRTKTDHAVVGGLPKFSVLLYGRYCNGNRFAGEMDLLEAFDDVKKRYPIDEDRVLNIGFSMGGGACWQFATHYSDLFAAASPGAGFAETLHFLALDHEDASDAPAYQKTLWQLYDSTDWATNLFDVPVIAYSGELDLQKQSADEMQAAMSAQGLALQRVIGPHTKHAYEPGAKAELDRRLNALLEQGRDWNATHVRFVTYTLRYNRMKWVTIDSMGHEWERADVDATIGEGSPNLVITTHNVNALTIDPPMKGSVTIDGTAQPAIAGGPVHYVRGESGWTPGSLDEQILRKRHGLQGPIDDAFMERFLIVRPTGKAANEKVGAWTEAECAHAIDHWRKQFRGEAPVKLDSQVTDADIASSNLVLFGDPSSNRIIARIASGLPIRWGGGEIAVGSKSFAADHDVLAAIYPNPLNPKRYIVLNSGVTFREYDYLNNARQTPKLPDYGVIDVDVPATPRAPGGVVDAGFFGERWELPKDGGP